MSRIRVMIVVLVLVLAGGLSLFMLRPHTYTATAYMQILTQRPYFVYSETERMPYDQYVKTQFAIMRSPLIVDKALESPDIARLPVILRQRDKAGWLAKNLKLQQRDESEMVTISISTPVPEDSAKIVNAVVNAFFEYYANQSNDWNHRLIMQLNLEYNRQQAAARLLQDEIRSAMEQAARQGGGVDGLAGGIAHHESLLKDVYLNETKLMSLQAELKMLKEVVQTATEQRKIDLQRQIMEKEMAVRASEIFVQNLKDKYKQQLRDIGDRTTKIVDVSFQQEQLKRYNDVLRLLQERITRLETERHAPEQIQLKKKATVRTEPDSRWFW